MKKYFAEMIGTMVLVLMGCGSAVFSGGIAQTVGAGTGTLGVALAFGLAVVAMAGIGFSWGSDNTYAWAYGVGIVAVLIKMVEALLRMPGLLRKPQARGRGRNIDKKDLL